jgi:predicted dithiol-disulfide oxidoreductase (DUF899 family)
MSDPHTIVSHDAWLEARKRLLAKEKEFNRLRDQLSAERRELPWEPVDKPYVFQGPNGRETLAELFAGRSQLVVYHFMLGADWQEGCKSCSFWADNFNGVDIHLAHRDVTLLAISSAPFDKIEAFRKRMGWTFKWVSSAGCDFNHDYHVTFAPDDLSKGEVYYNYRRAKVPVTEMPGFSVFCKAADGTIYHTYSTYSRGLDMLNGAYHILDLVPKGRDEASLQRPMAWVRLHDQYEATS